MHSIAPVTVRVPGSTSNCGAGFDTLGLALQLHNTVTLTPREELGFQPEREPDGRAAALIERAVGKFERATETQVSGFFYRIDGDVPISRGLGSSVTVLAGVLAGLNHWAKALLGEQEMVKLLTRIEGHPDNATAGFWGGFCVSMCGRSAADFEEIIRINIPASLKFVVASPDLEIATKGSREVLPQHVSHGDATRSINSAAFLTAAMATGDFSKLKGAAFDFMHEPYRLPGITGGAEAIQGGIKAGALTGWLSGSGSSVLCVVNENEALSVKEAMHAAFTAADTTSIVQILSADNEGLSIVSD